MFQTSWYFYFMPPLAWALPTIFPAQSRLCEQSPEHAGIQSIAYVRLRAHFPQLHSPPMSERAQFPVPLSRTTCSADHPQERAQSGLVVTGESAELTALQKFSFLGSPASDSGLLRVVPRCRRWPVCPRSMSTNGLPIIVDLGPSACG